MTRVSSPRSPAAHRTGSRTASTPSNGSDPSPEPPAPDSVRAALRALATGDPPPRPEHRETVADADAATASAVDAAAFLRAGRLPELARAVADAEAAAREEASGGAASGEAAEIAERGRRALATLRRLDSAVECAFGPADEIVESTGAATAGGESSDDSGGSGTPDGPRVAGRDHFRSGRDIVLPRTDQSADR